MKQPDLNFKTLWPSTHLSDEKIKTHLRAAIEAEDLHPSNLKGREGEGSLNHRLITLAYAGLTVVARSLPRIWGYAAFGGAARIVGRLIWPARQRVMANLQRAFPDKPKAERRAIARAFWQGFGHSLFETLDVDRFMRHLDEGIEIKGLEHVLTAQKNAKGRGIVFVHAHQATWEIAFPVLERIAGPLSGIYAPASVPSLHRRVLYRRIVFGARAYPRNFVHAAARAVRDLREGRNLVIALDQRAKGQKVPFFGHPAKTTRGPIRIAAMAQSPLIPLDMARTGTGRFTVTFHKDLMTAGDTDAVLARYNTQLEGWITKRPADWFWLHNRWR